MADWSREETGGNAVICHQSQDGCHPDLAKWVGHGDMVPWYQHLGRIQLASREIETKYP